MNPVSLSSLPSRPRSRIVWPRHNLFVAAGALLWSLSGCTLPEPNPGDPDDPGDPVDPNDPGVSEGRQVRTAFQVSVGNLDEPLGVFVVLDEAPNRAGLFDGTLTLSRLGVAQSVSVAAILDGESELHVGAGAGGGYQWDELYIDLRDADADGVYESGAGFISGTINRFYVDDEFGGDFQAAPDGYQVTASAHPDGMFSGALMPWQPLLIEFGQPVLRDHVSSFAVLADGKRVQGTTSLDHHYDPHYTSVRFVPETFYPLGAELTVVPQGLVNALGTQVEADPGALPVVSDPGSPVNVNLGFEQGLAGWSTVGLVTTAAGHGDAAPVEGTAMAVIQTGYADDVTDDSRLIGYLDVPEDASTLDLSLEVMSEDQLPTAVTVRLYRDDSWDEVDAFEIYEFGHEAETFVPCDCTDLYLTRRTGPFRRQVSLAGFRGERVFLELRLDGNHRRPSSPPREQAQAFGVLPLTPPPPPTFAALVVDDLQIR